MKMNKSILALAAITALFSFSGCSDDINYDSTESEGRVLLVPSILNDVKADVTEAGTGSKKARKAHQRVAQTNDELAAATTIWISNSKGAVRKYNGFSQVPAEGIWLAADNYVAEAWTGDSVPASFEHKHFKARVPFTIAGGSTIQLNLECKIANVVVDVKYDDNIPTLLSDYTVTVGHKAGSLTYTADESGIGDKEATPGYFMMPTFDKNLKYTFTGKQLVDGTTVTKEGVIENAKPGYKYTIRVKQNGGSEEEFGGALFNIEIDETEIEVADVITINSAPAISGIGFDMSEPLVGEPGTLTEKKLWIQATSAIKSVELACPAFDDLGIGGTAFEILGMNQNILSQLQAKGFKYQLVQHTGEEENPEFEEMKITLGEEFMKVFGEGSHTMTVTVTDANGKVGVGKLNMILTDAVVTTVAISPSAATTWSDHVTLTGRVMKADATNLGFKYRPQGSSEWQSVNASSAAGSRRRAPHRANVGDTYTAVVDGLTPGTTYEYMAVCDGFEPANAETFTTEPADQLKNASFEDWDTTSNKYYLICKSASDMFWDCGNQGSSTMNKNVTLPATDKVHDGTYSLKMESQFVGIGSIGKFAAGNAFVGKYLLTDGTNGVLGWGRPFTSRPKALKGWIHYTPGTVAYTATGAPDIVKGEPDKGIIYIAIVDGTMSSFNDEKWPCIVKTKEGVYFDKNGSNVIAYGEKVFEGATAGENLVEFEIPLDYKRTDTKAVNIIVTMSASKGGDYFAGGPSVMYVDDLKLVY